MKYFFVCLIIATSTATAGKSQDLKLKCLSKKENEYIGQLYSIFEKKLINIYGKLKTTELMFNYVNDFSLGKINTSFLKSFQIDTTSGEFHQMFIKESEMPREEDSNITSVGHGAIIDEHGEIIEIGDINKGKSTKKPKDYDIINPNSNYISCLMQQKSKNYKVNNLFKYFAIDIDPSVAASTLRLSYEQNEYKDQLLQVYIMFHLFLLPNLQNM